jgi:hypothetical protein
MDLERFDGHLEQLDYREGRIHRLYLVDRDGQRLVLTIESVSDLEDIRAGYSGSLAFLARDQRPQVTIAQQVGAHAF